jgi:uncharacterized membrane protein
VTKPKRHDAEMEPGLERLVFFSDAVFAIAITLLVVDLRVPEMAGRVTDARLADAVAELSPRIFAYALSFAVIGLYWLTHWRRFSMIDHLDERMVLLNLLLLAFVAFIPFPTSLIGEYGDHDLAVVIYASTLGLSGLVGTASWLYAARANLLRPRVSRNEVRLGALRGIAVPLVMLGSLAILPLTGPGAVEVTWLAIFPAQWLIARWLHRTARGQPKRSAE